MDKAATAPLAVLRIVIVEDDPVTRQFLRNVIEKQLGHEVIGEAATGTEMVRTVLNREPDVVLFDIHLPHQDGLAALAQIYQERVVAAVAITADPDSELVRRAMEEHVLSYLVKPVDEKQLRPALLVAWAIPGTASARDREYDAQAELAEPQGYRTGQGRAHEKASLDRGRGFSPASAGRDEQASSHG